MSKRARSRKGRSQSLSLLVVLGGVVLAGVLIWLGNRAAAPATLSEEEMAEIATSGTVAGWEEAPVTVEVFSDFQCIHCKSASAQTVAPLLENEVKDRKVQVIYRFYPALGPESQAAAEAAFCAAQQDRFWPYHDLLFANQQRPESGGFSADRLRGFAEEAGLDLEAWSACLDDQATQERIRSDVAKAIEIGVRGTPTFLVNAGENATKVEGAVPYADLLPVIEEALGGGE